MDFRVIHADIQPWPKGPTVIVRLQVWDTAGLSDFRAITRSYYSDADGIIILYDVTNRASFAHVPGWVSEIEEVLAEHASAATPPDHDPHYTDPLQQRPRRHEMSSGPPAAANYNLGGSGARYDLRGLGPGLGGGAGWPAIVLAGNKADAVPGGFGTDARQVSYEEGLAFARRMGMHFFETSAKSAWHVDTVFKAAAEEMHVRKVAAAARGDQMMMEGHPRQGQLANAVSMMPPSALAAVSDNPGGAGGSNGERGPKCCLLQ
eukprot:jgi/Mesvir1/4704/Mv05630-RA.1